MPAYAIFVLTKEHDAALLAEYRKMAHPSLKQYGAKPRVVAVTPKVVVEGDSVENLIMMEFVSMDALRTWYDSPEYRPARELRKRACDCLTIFTEGLE